MDFITLPQMNSSGRWANSGVDINLDNLSLGGPKKSSAPSMKQLQTTTIPSIPAQPPSGKFLIVNQNINY